MKREVLKELPLSAAALTGGMLQEYQQLLVEEMLPYQIEILEQGGALDMIRRAAGYRVPERTEPGRSGAEKKAGRADRTAGTGPVRGWLPASHYAGVPPFGQVPLPAHVP